MKHTNIFEYIAIIDIETGLQHDQKLQRAVDLIGTLRRSRLIPYSIKVHNEQIFIGFETETDFLHASLILLRNDDLEKPQPVSVCFGTPELAQLRLEDVENLKTSLEISADINRLGSSIIVESKIWEHQTMLHIALSDLRSGVDAAEASRKLICIKKKLRLFSEDSK